MTVRAFIIRRYEDSSKEGGEKGIKEAENIGVMLGVDQNQALEKTAAYLHGQQDTILTKRTNEHGTRLYQQVIRRPPYTYFLEEVELIA